MIVSLFSTGHGVSPRGFWSSWVEEPLMVVAAYSEELFTMHTMMIGLVALVAGLAGGYGLAQATRAETATVTECSNTQPAKDHDMTSMSMDLGEADSE